MSFLKKEKNEKDILNSFFNNIKFYYQKLLQLNEKAKNREKLLLNKVITAKKFNKEDLALIYAKEVVEVRRFQQSLEQIALILEQAIIRIETLKEIGTFNLILHSLKSLFNEIKNVKNVSPEAMKIFQDFFNNFEEIKITTPLPDVDINEYYNVSNEEIDEILKEASEEAKKRITLRFPDMPTSYESISSSKFTELEAEGYTNSIINSKEDKILSLEDKVLKYIIDNKGKVNIRDCSEKLGISLNEVNQALANLVKYGKIKIVN